MSPTPPIATFVFTDIEGSTRLWEEQPERMQQALARHDALSDACIRQHRGRLVKRTGDGVHAVFDDAADAVAAVLALQLGLAPQVGPEGLALRVRCGLHAGDAQARDGDYYGPALNRAARVMAAAHGGQVLLSDAVASRVTGRLPEGATLQPLGRVRLRDLSTPEFVHQLCHPSLRAGFPPLRSLEATPNNLPQQLNSFVGREREMAQTRQLLRSTRLLTLLGMGGLGKSRLSVQLGAEVLDDYPDGVWLVELAPLTDPRLVPQAVANTLRVKEDAGHGVTEAVLDWVRDKRVLLILDNCEHVRDAVAMLARRLLQAGPGVRVLASSRDVLGVAGETQYALPPLAVPEADAQPGADVGWLLQHESVRLFVERSTAVRPDFALSADNADFVTRICRQLDGIPLALELAAARARALSPQAMAVRLSDRFRLLVNPDHTVLPRQRTLRALIDWSHDLLDEAERRLFRRLAIFAGGWSLEAAESVCSDTDLDGPLVLDLLLRLVDKSLVVCEASGDRYRMLETVRAYARERLVDAGEWAAMQRQHLAWYVGRAEEARAGLAGEEQVTWLLRLQQDRDNFLAAHAGSAAVDGGDELAVRLLHALRPYWVNRGDLTVAHDMAADLMARPGLQARDGTRCRVLFAAGQLAFLMGRHEQALPPLEEGLQIARESGDLAIVVRMLQPLAMAAMALGAFDRAARDLDEAIRHAEAQDDRRELAAALNALGMLHRLQWKLDLARPVCERVLTLLRQERAEENIAIGLLNLAMVDIGSGATASAAAMLDEVVDIAVRTASRPLLVSGLEVGAGLAAACGEWAEAACLEAAAGALRAQAHLLRDPADERFMAQARGTVERNLPVAEQDAARALGRTWAGDAALQRLKELLARQRSDRLARCLA